MTRASYNSAINNAFDFLNRSDGLGKKARLSFLEESGLKLFSEKNFEKSNQKIKKSQVIKAWAKIKRDRKKLLDKAWKQHTFRNVKLRNNRRAKGKFVKANKSKIMDEIGNSFETYFNSPDAIT